MSSFSGVWVNLLSGAIEAGRRALLELDPKEIPAPLSRVAAYQGGRLPPPLATKLLAEIDRNEWFRGKVVDEWDGDAGETSDLFLNRPDGWWLDLADRSVAADAAHEQSQLDGLQTRLEEVAAKRRAAIKKATDYKKALDKAQRRSKVLTEEARRSVEQRLSAEVAQIDQLRAELATAQTRFDDLAAEHRELVEAFDALRSRLMKARRSRGEDSERTGGSSSLPRDPVKLARLLDLQSAEMGREIGTTRDVEEMEPNRLTLDAGIRPDSSDAIRWLLGLDEPVVVLVDGYNAQFHVDGSDFTSGGARRRLVESLKRLRAAAGVKHRIAVVYDSTLPGERDGRTSLGGIEVRFAENDRIADEEIVEMTAGLDRVVVVSSDRAVRDGAEANGAVVLWSEALSGWLERL